MGFLKGSATARRFQVQGQLEDGWKERAVESLARLAFREQMRSRAVEDNVGWTHVDNPGAQPSDMGAWSIGQWVVLGVRLDRKVVPAKLLQIKQEAAIRQTMAEKGLERIGAVHKREIREAVKEELLGQALPLVRHVELVWDTVSGEVLIFSTSDRVVDMVVGLFRETFGLELQADRLVDWLGGRDGWPWEKVTEAVAKVTGEAQLDMPIGQMEERPTDLLHGHIDTLASEFLLWTWFASEQLFGSFDLPEGPVDVWIDDKMTFLVQEERAVVNAFKGGAPSTTPEAKLAILSGKGLKLVKLGLRRGEEEWSVILKASPAGLDLAAVKLPSVVKEGLEEMVYERSYLLDKVSRTLRELFRMFFEACGEENWRAGIDRWLMGEE